MPLDLVVEDVTTLDESVQSFYVKDETDGVYKLDIVAQEGYAIENTAALKSALAKERENAKKATNQLKTFQTKYADLDPDEAREAMIKLQELSEFDPKTEADRLASEKYEAQKKRLETSITKKYEAIIENEYKPIVEKHNALESKFKQEVLSSEALKAIAEEQGDVDLLLPHVISKMRIERNDVGDYEKFLVDKDGEPLYDNKGQKMDTRTFVAGLKNKFPAAFKAPVKSGGGTAGTGRKEGGVDTSKMTAAQMIVAGLQDRS